MVDVLAPPLGQHHNLLYRQATCAMSTREQRL